MQIEQIESIFNQQASQEKYQPLQSTQAHITKRVSLKTGINDRITCAWILLYQQLNLCLRRSDTFFPVVNRALLIIGKVFLFANAM